MYKKPKIITHQLNLKTECQFIHFLLSVKNELYVYLTVENESKQFIRHLTQ